MHTDGDQFDWDDNASNGEQRQKPFDVHLFPTKCRFFLSTSSSLSVTPLSQNTATGVDVELSTCRRFEQNRESEILPPITACRVQTTYSYSPVVRRGIFRILIVIEWSDRQHGTVTIFVPRRKNFNGRNKTDRTA